MVEVYRDHSKPYRDVAKSLGYQPSRHRFLRFPDNGSLDISPGEIAATQDLSRRPEMYRPARLFINVTDDRGYPVRALMVPEECRRLRSNGGNNYREVGPAREEEMFVVTVSGNQSSRWGLDILVLVDNPDSASRIAVVSANRILGFPGDLLIADPKKVSEAEFIKKGMELLNKGILPSDHIVRRVPALNQHAQRLGMINGS